MYDPVEITKLFVFGTNSPSPDDYNQHIRPTGATPASITYNMSDYMTGGGGRFAYPSLFGAVEKFFTTAIADGTYTYSQIATLLGLSASDLTVGISQYGTGIGSADHAERSYIFGSTQFRLDTSRTTFEVVGGVKTIKNMEVRVFDDNFDFTAGNPLAQLINDLLLEPTLDPYGLGRGPVDILFSGSGKTYASYSQTDFATDEGREGEVSVIGSLSRPFKDAAGIAILPSSYLLAIASDPFLSFKRGNLKVIYGTPGNDNLSFLNAELSFDIYFGYLIAGGAGNDTLNGNQFADELQGGEGSDVLNGALGNDTLIGGADNDTLNGGLGDDLFIAGAGDDSIDGGSFVFGLFAGNDRSQYRGALADYDVEFLPDDTVRIRDKVSGRDGTDILKGVEVAVFSNKSINLGPGQDIAFVIDTTGSMFDDIDAVKSSSSQIINAIFDGEGGFLDSRIAVVGYNDPGTNTFLNFTDQPKIDDRKTAAINAINSISVGGGGDFPELVNSGLLRALSGGAGEWNKEAISRSIILFGDAPPKDTELRAQVLELAANIGVSIPSTLRSMSIVGDIETSSVTTGLTATRFSVSTVDAEGTEETFPVQIFTILIGNDPTTAADFNSLATQTGGKAFTAADAGEIVPKILEVIDEVTTIVTLAVSPGSVTEDGTTNFVYTFTRTGATTDALTVNYTVGGTATFDTDYTQTGAASFTATTGTVTFAAGSDTATVTIDPTADTNVEDDETVTLNLAPGTGYAIGTTDAVVGIITNTDTDTETPGNQAPTDLALSATTVNENVPVNTVIGTFSSTDPDTGNSFTYSLIAGAGDTDNSAFSIVGNQLQINNSPDFETKNSYSIRVKTTDQGGLSFEKTLTITVNDVNETPGNQAPTNLALSATTVNENVPVNTVIGTFSTTDPDTGNTFTYSLIAGTGDTDNSAFSIVGNQLQINNSPDFETKNSYSIRVKTTDQGGLSFEKTLTITVNDVNETPTNQAPTDLALSATTVNENVPVNTVIGTFSSTDPDTGNTFTYSLIAGTGDTDNTAFSIVGNQLQINNSPDFETKNSYSIRVKTTDQGGLSFEKTLTITVNDVSETPSNQAPTALIFQNAVTELAENVNVTPEFKVADLLIEDDGLGTNNLFLTGRDRERFLIQNSALFYVGFTPNFEAQNSYEVTVNVDDTTVGVTPDLTQTLTLNITDINEAPTALILANSTNAIAENTDTSQGVKVADIQISDDALGTNSLSLLGSDQSSFQIRGRELFFIGKADFEAQSLYNLTVAVTDTTLNPAPNATPDATVNFTLEITNLPDQAVNPQALQFNNTGNGQGSLVFNFSNLPGSIQVTAIEEGLRQTGAFFNNVVGLYPVADDNGAVFDSLDLDGDGNATELIQPGQAGYARSALSQAVNNFILRASGEGANQSTTAAEFGDVLLEGGRRYAPFVIANGGNPGESLQGSIQAFLTKNPDNVAATLENYISHEVAYFSFGAANPDGAEHLRSRGNNIFGFEDLPGNLPNISDNDFNDGILAFNFIA
ncbi:cadherin domain-containing protein [Microcystis aeruginosa]|nr:cadherin domain-containing protein [Microcystis aeruginosa]